MFQRGRIKDKVKVKKKIIHEAFSSDRRRWISQKKRSRKTWAVGAGSARKEKVLPSLSNQPPQMNRYVNHSSLSLVLGDGRSNARPV